MWELVGVGVFERELDYLRERGLAGGGVGGGGVGGFSGRVMPSVYPLRQDGEESGAFAPLFC